MALDTDLLKDVTLLVTIPSSGRKFPVNLPYSKNGNPYEFVEFSLGGLERAMNSSFATRGYQITRDYFLESSSSYPQNLSFFVFGINQSNNYEIVSGLIAQDEEVGGFKFTYYDKIFTIPDYQNKGLKRNMIGVARIVSDGKRIKPAILRTSNPEKSASYSKQSDKVAFVDGYYVHGFGFLNKTTDKELFEGANQKFDIAAQYVASKPSTLISL